MILTKKEILKEIKAKRIIIEPYDEKAVGPASIDLTLDNQIRVFKNRIARGPIDVTDTADYKTITKLVDVKNKYVLRPGEFILGITKEKITLPEDICGWLNSRSRFARLGLAIHITAPFVQPGVSNKQVLEIYNVGPNKLALIPGQKLCQIILQKCAGKAKYEGVFKEQSL